MRQGPNRPPKPGTDRNKNNKPGYTEGASGSKLQLYCLKSLIDNNRTLKGLWTLSGPKNNMRRLQHPEEEDMDSIIERITKGSTKNGE